MRGAEVYLNGQMIGVTNGDPKTVCRATRKMDGVYATESTIEVDTAEIGNLVFARFGRYEEPAATVANNGQPMATERQIIYLRSLGVQIERNMSKSRASQLIDAAKSHELGSVNGFYSDGSN